MRVIFSLLIAAMIFAVSSHAKAAPNEPVYVATYIETQPQAAEQAIAALKAEAAAARAETGSVAVQLLREIGRDNRFVLFEIWKDQAAFDTHQKNPRVKPFAISSMRP